MCNLKNALLAMLSIMTFLHGALSMAEDPSPTPIVPQNLLATSNVTREVSLRQRQLPWLLLALYDLSRSR